MPPLSPYLDTAIHKHGPQCGITHVSLPCYIVWGCMLHDMRRGLKREEKRVSLTWPVLGRSRQDSCSLNIGRCHAFLHYAQLGKQHLGQVQVSICLVLERWRWRRSDGLSRGGGKCGVARLGLVVARLALIDGKRRANCSG